MPNLPKKRCRYAGCLNTTRNRFCDEHAALAMKLIDNRRGSARERGYDSDWEKVAELRRSIDCCLCQPCLKNHNLLTASRTVDHIIPIHVRPDLRLDIDNTQVICSPCHTRKTLDDQRRYGHARLGVTIVSTVEIEENFTSMDLSKFTVSFLADDILRMRYVSINGQLRKMLMVIKMRRSEHSIDMHEYQITPEGIVIGEPLRGYRGLTSGIPQPWSMESGQNDPEPRSDQVVGDVARERQKPRARKEGGRTPPRPKRGKDSK